MGIAGTLKAVTSTELVGRAISIQLGNRDWVTSIECINACGWAISPFIILPGKRHQNIWYRDLPPDWAIAVSDNSWTTDTLGVDWIQHFNRCTESRTVGG